MSGPLIEEPDGELVAGKYRLTRMIGRGGMGSVWEGVHTTLGTHVAVKFIESEYADSTDARTRFENEARATGKLQSKHVVKVYDHGLMPDGRPYIVMEYLTGEPLDSRLDRVGRLTPAETLRVVQQVARALNKAHQAGIVHRDLKPENVFLVWDDEDAADVAKVVDFGIAKFTSTGMGVSSSTRTGSVLGTPYYMSPEQARGLRSVDARTDLWALGVITYRCIVGELPFNGEAVGDLLVKICTAPLPVPSQNAQNVPPGFDAWFAKALDRDPVHRFQTASELADALALAIGGARASLGSQPMDLGVVAGPAGPGKLASDSQNSTLESARVAAVAMGTGGTFTQTPALGVPKQRGGALLVAGLGVGALAMFGVLAVGLLVFLNYRSSPPAPSALGAMDPVPSAPSDPENGPSVDPAVVPPEPLKPVEPPVLAQKSPAPPSSARPAANRPEPAAAASASAAPAKRQPVAERTAPKPEPRPAPARPRAGPEPQDVTGY